MALLKCKICGGDIELNSEKTLGTCECCGSLMTFPKGDDEQKLAMFNRGNAFRRQGEFDKAFTIFENIVRNDDTDAEAHWCCALCRFGIEYVEDPSTLEYIPTCHRASFDSFLDDVDYKAAVENADGVTKRQYQKEALKIADIQKGILATSQNEEPFDVFICYKETDDATGQRTKDSIDAQEIYYQLTNEGYRVFFSRITLEDKVGAEFEPYIFAALNSAKVMIVIGSKPEYFNAVWVKNEWSRFLAIMRKDRSKLLLPCYRDIDPYDLPEQLSALQSYDMAKIGFIQDLIRGIKKIISASEPKETVKETVIVNNTPSNANVTSLIGRGFMSLEDGEWSKADGFFEEVLNQDFHNAEAYLGKLMAELKIKSKDNLKNAPQPFDNNNNCIKASRFDSALAEKLKADNKFIRERNENNRKTEIYNKAVSNMNSVTAHMSDEYTAEFKKSYAENAIRLFESIIDWNDSKAKIEECKKLIETYEKEIEEEKIAAENARNKAKARKKKLAVIIIPIVAVFVIFVILMNTVIIPRQNLKRALALLEAGNYDEAYSMLESLGESETIKSSIYDRAVELVNNKEYESAIVLFNQITGYKDTESKIKEIKHKEAKSLLEAKKYDEAYLIITELEDVNELKESIYNVASELADAGNRFKAMVFFIRIAGYKDANAIMRTLFAETVSAGYYHTVGLKADGTVVSTEITNFDYGQSDVSDWKDIVAVSTGDIHTVGLKADGTVVAVGDNDKGRCDVSGWTDIVAISAGDYHTVGLKADGTVVAVGNNDKGQCDVSDWTDIVAVSAGGWHTVGLKADGTVVAVGAKGRGQCAVSEWTDIVAVSAGDSHTVGLKADGTVVAAKYTGSSAYNYGQCNVSDWTDIVAISANGFYTVGLKADGTVVATGNNYTGRCNVSGLEDIVEIYAGSMNAVGLKADGTVVSTEIINSDYGQSDVYDWKNIKVNTNK